MIRELNQVPDEPHIRATVRGYAQQTITQCLHNSGYAPNKGFVGTGGFHIEAFAEAGELTGFYIRVTLAELSTLD